MAVLIKQDGRDVLTGLAHLLRSWGLCPREPRWLGSAEVPELLEGFESGSIFELTQLVPVDVELPGSTMTALRLCSSLVLRYRNAEDPPVADAVVQRLGAPTAPAELVPVRLLLGVRHPHMMRGGIL